MNNETGRRYTVPRWPRVLLLRLATGTVMWVSSAATSTAVLGLQPQPSGNDVLRRWQTFAAQPVADASDSTLATGIAFCSALYAGSCMLIYCTAPRTVAIVSTACILLVFSETLWNSLNVSLVERLAVILPSFTNVGLSSVLVHRSKEQPDLVLEGRKSEV